MPRHTATAPDQNTLNKPASALTGTDNTSATLRKPDTGLSHDGAASNHQTLFDDLPLSVVPRGEMKEAQIQLPIRHTDH